MDTSVPVQRSRRALLGAALGVAAGGLASAIEAPKALAAGSDGSTVVIGGSYLAAQSQTKIVNTSAVLGDNDFNRAMWLESQVGLGLYAAGEQGVFGLGNQYGVGAWASNATGSGVYATQGSEAPFITPAPAGVTGVTYVTDGGAGVRGYAYGDSAGTAGVWGSSGSASTAYGVYGVATSATTSVQGVGVYGHAMSGTSGVGVYGYAEAATGANYGVIGHVLSPAATGVYGFAPAGGTGVRAVSTGGVALHTSGRVKADKVSGVATISAGHSTVTIKPGVAIGTASFVLLSPRGNLGGRSLWSTLSSSGGTITIRVSSAVSSSTQVGWLLLG